MEPLTSTYRLQFTSRFTFDSARELVPYLARLGISHVYASPIFRATPGSTHGYDVLDHNEINPELGGRAGFDALVEALHEHGIGWIQDMVPNHMAYSPLNPMLVDLFEHGEKSRFRDFFDVDWEPPFQSMHGRLIAPFLGDLYGEVLNRGELSLEYGEGGFAIRYYEMAFPLRVETYRDVMARRLPEIEQRLGREHPEMLKLLGVLYTLESLDDEVDPGTRADKVGFAKRMLWELYRGNAALRAYLDRSVGDHNGEPGDPESWSVLNELHWKQAYRLAFWKVASEEINYRRFFSINGLICLRMESPAVFAHTHRLLFALIDSAAIDGLRIDHIDGLYEPGEYLARLRRRVGDRPIFVEKILHPDEELPAHWATDGTTGYDSLNLVNALFIRRASAKRIRSFYRGLTGDRTEYTDALADRKRLILFSEMSGDLDNLTRYVRRVVGDDRHGIDITAPSLRRALAEVMVHFPVYRSYVTDTINREQDIDYIHRAIAAARRRLPHHGYELNYIEGFLLLAYGDHASEETRIRWGDVVLRFQQFTGPLMAKGLEDTLMYGYLPLLSVNEVGGSPDEIGIASRSFHDAMLRTTERHPRTMTTSSTHDTKRGEDTRIRIDALSHLFDRWARAVRQWRTMNRDLRRRTGGVVAPDAADEYLIYQTLIGVLHERPADDAERTRVTEELRERLDAFVLKALREAKRHTTWSSPNEAYESAASHYLGGVLERLAGGGEGDEFRRSFHGILREVFDHAETTIVAHQALRLTLPGIPDVYRGAELLDLSLVDPDNRRPVDWSARAKALERVGRAIDAALRAGGVDADSSRDERGHEGLLVALAQRPVEERKLAVISLLARLRRAVPELFRRGSYVPLGVSGAKAESTLAFARTHADDALVVVARRAAPVAGDAQSVDVRLPFELGTGHYADLLGGGVIEGEDGVLALGSRLASLPCAILRRLS